MIKIIYATAIVLVLAGCSSNKPSLHRTTVIDSCCTVLEYNADNKWVRINNYINSRVRSGHISECEASVIMDCLKRCYKEK
jgi:hypothetical protein